MTADPSPPPPQLNTRQLLALGAAACFVAQGDALSSGRKKDAAVREKHGSALLEAVCSSRHGIEGSPGFGWLPVSSAPRDGTPIILLHRTHGPTYARFEPGEWHDNLPEGPREYTGDFWICGDDAFEVDSERYTVPEEGYDEPDALGWVPKDVLPIIPEGAGP